MAGQPEDIKREYSAVSIHPKEKVLEKLKEREQLRKLARESNLISGNQNDVDDLQVTKQKWIVDKMLKNVIP